MPSIFISYRREDTSGEAGRLAGDLASRFGRGSVFIDIDAIDPGANFEQRIHEALDSCDVTLVLIGDRWLGATLPDGKQRIDNEGDYVRKEVAAALSRGDVAVVPVLVEGAKMPSAEQLPPEVSDLAKINAFELSSRRWRYDLRQLYDIAQRYDPWWRRPLRRLPRWARWGGPVLALASVGAVIAIATSGGGASRLILAPASIPPKTDECSAQLQIGADGTAGPVTCANGHLNTNAWQYYAGLNLSVMRLGPDALPPQVQSAMCSDLRQTGSRSTNPIESDAYQLSALYYGWRFGIVPTPFNC